MESVDDRQAQMIKEQESLKSKLATAEKKNKESDGTIRQLKDKVKVY